MVRSTIWKYILLYLSFIFFPPQDFFKDLEGNQQFFQQTKRAGHYEGETLHGPHMDLMSKRLEAVTKGSDHNQAHMEYLLCHADVLGYIAAAVDKVAFWTAKCGLESEVETRLVDYMVRLFTCIWF